MCSEIPSNLWQDDKLVLPHALANALRDELQERGLYEDACIEDKPDSQLFGGKEAESALSHFTHRFKASAARVEFVVLNPHGTFEPLATDLHACFLDGKVAVLDIACGSGGGLLGLLMTFVELRQQMSIPRLPLEIRLLAADISDEARFIHNAMLQRVESKLATSGISIRWKHMKWDVTDAFSTARLMDEWREFAPTSEEYLVFISAFSGFADDNFSTVSQAVRDMTVRLHDKKALIAWVEPIMKKSERFMGKVRRFFKDLPWKRIVALREQMEEEFKYQHPFTKQILPGRARVMSLDKAEI